MRYSIAGLALLSSLAAAVDPIIVKGQDFVNSVSGDRFVVIGVDYQPGGAGIFTEGATEDVFSNPETCLRDAALFQRLGVNTIRTYIVSPTLNHDECMSIFNSVGIYVLLDVSSPVSGQHIDRSSPLNTYNSGYLEHIFSVVEAFKGYPNLLGFFSGNEIINDLDTAMANPPVMRSVIRDVRKPKLKNYIANHADRPIPVGYSAADVREFLQPTFDYLACDLGDEFSRSDMFALNSYSWCGSESSFTLSGYNLLADLFEDASIPSLFSEYGCNDPAPRVFEEVPSIYGPEMTMMSGGLVFEYSEEPNNYGLVEVESDGSVRLLGDFEVLRSQFAKIDIGLLQTLNDTAAGIKPPKCSPDLITVDGFSTDFDIPQLPAGVSAMIENGITSAPTGQIVSVTQTAVALPVYDQNGAPISGLAITPTSVAVPTGGNTGGRPSGSRSGAGASPSQTGAANRLSGAAILAFGAAIVAL